MFSVQASPPQKAQSRTQHATPFWVATCSRKRGLFQVEAGGLTRGELVVLELKLGLNGSSPLPTRSWTLSWPTKKRGGNIRSDWTAQQLTKRAFWIKNAEKGKTICGAVQAVRGCFPFFATFIFIPPARSPLSLEDTRLERSVPRIWGSSGEVSEALTCLPLLMSHLCTFPPFFVA